MSLLIDTQILIWVYDDDAHLSTRVRDRLATGEEVFISFATAWEYGQKRLLRPHELPVPFELLLTALPFTELPCTMALGKYAQTLPLIHRDPFDRMLIAQAIEHRLTLVTSDTTIHQYPVTTFW